jgi:CheY-like chemotaxis protein
VTSSLKFDPMSSSWRRSADARGLAKRVLVVDPDQKTWELPARLLIAQGHLVHRISHIAEAPPCWPRHLYDLVVVATEDPASPEVVSFCQKLNQVQPPVPVVLLAENSAVNPLAALVISRDRPAAEMAEGIAQLLR